MISWVVYIAIGLVIGGAVGFFLGRLDDLSQKQKRVMQEKLDQARKELAEYKHDVTDHFIATAGLVNNLTESYQAVHEHLVKGANVLCDHQVAVDRLEVTRSVGLEKKETITDEANERVEAKVSSGSAPPMGNESPINASEATVQKNTARESEPLQNPKPTRNDPTQTGEINALRVEQSNDAGQVQDSLQEEVSGEKLSAKDGDTTPPSDDSAVVSDQNDLTMASRMVH